MVHKLFHNKIGSERKANVIEVLAQKSHKPAIKKFKRRKVYQRFKEKIFAVDLGEC